MVRKSNFYGVYLLKGGKCSESDGLRRNVELRYTRPGAILRVSGLVAMGSTFRRHRVLPLGGGYILYEDESSTQLL